MPMRALSELFMHDILHPTGPLALILARVKRDHTLMISIRAGYINIYYRGGNLMRIREQPHGGYLAEFDHHYNDSNQPIPTLPDAISNQADADRWLDGFPILKQTMDFYFSTHPKPEREYQQVVAHENNDSTISNESEYFIADIEAADSNLGARFDMLAIRWLASQRKHGNRCKPAFIEMKYGDGALGGSAGLLKHLKDMDALISDRDRYASLLEAMQTQFNQLDQLSLLKFNKGVSNAHVSLDPADRPEAIFILANHNPRSAKLKSILSNPQVDTYVQAGHFDLKFFVASFAGYGLHAGCMMGLEEFKKNL